MNKVNKHLPLNNTIYFLLRFLVILSMLFELNKLNIHNILLCMITIVILKVPIFISKKVKIELPVALEIFIYLFIYASMILGEIENLYIKIPVWDTILHSLSGFLCAAIGSSLINVLTKEENANIILGIIISFCFSMTIGILWEFGEFAADHYLHQDMQKDRIVHKISSVVLSNESTKPITINNITKTIIYSNKGIITIDGYLEIGLIDTIKDLFVNLLGAIVFIILNILYIQNNIKYKLLKEFIPYKIKNT